MQGHMNAKKKKKYTELFLYPVSFILKHNRGFILSAREFLSYRR